MLEQFNEIIEKLFILANLEWTSSFSGVLTFLSILIVSGVISYLFMKIFKNRFLGFLVASACSIWLYEQVFIKGLPLLHILIVIIIFLALLAIVFILFLAILIKRLPFPLKFMVKYNVP